MSDDKPISDFVSRWIDKSAQGMLNSVHLIYRKEHGKYEIEVYSKGDLSFERIYFDTLEDASQQYFIIMSALKDKK